MENSALPEVMEVGILSPRLGRLNQDKSKSYEQVDSKPAPEQWKGSVFVMFVVFGIASLTPWNMFITATAYFESKFKNSTTEIEENFPSYFQTGAICVDVVVSFVTVLLVRYIRMPILIYVANTLMLAVFGLTAVLSKVDSTAWSTNFFIMTETSFCLMCGGGAMYISTMWALTSAMNSIYIEAFLIGMTLAGIIASVLNIVTLSIPGVDFVGAGFWYFTAATAILLLALLLFVYFHLSHYVEQKHYSKIESDGSDSATDTATDSEHSSMLKLTKDTLCQGYTIFCVLFVTFIMFPAVLSALQSSSPASSTWAARYFKPVSLFLVFNVGDLVGRLIARFVEFPGRKLIPWYTTTRLLFVVLLLMCNLQPRSLPVWFKSDAIPTVLIFFFAVTSGQVLTLCLRYAPEVSESKLDKATIGTIMGFWGAIGRVLGSVSTYLMFTIIR